MRSLSTIHGIHGKNEHRKPVGTQVFTLSDYSNGLSVKSWDSPVTMIDTLDYMGYIPMTDLNSRLLTIS